MSQHRLYPGMDTDVRSGMAGIGKIVPDARMFGILPETERGVTWDCGRLEQSCGND